MFRFPCGQKLVRDIKLKIYDELDGSKKISIPREMYGLYAPPKEAITPLCNSFEECLQKAKTGDAPAMFELANRYETGDGTLKNADKSEQWLSASAERDYMPAIKKSGILKYAFKLYKQGSAEAALYLAEHPFKKELESHSEDEQLMIFWGRIKYLSIKSTPQWANFTFMWPSKSDSLFADFFEYKSLTSDDYLRAAAKLGSAEAMYKVAQQYFKNADYENAYLWFGRSANSRPDSAVFTGFLRGMGWGCPKNHEAGYLYLLSVYGIPTDDNADYTREMLNLAGRSLSKPPQIFEDIWFECVIRCFGLKPINSPQAPDSAKSNKVVALWTSLLDIDYELTEEAVRRLTNLTALRIDVSETVVLAEKALDEQKALKATIGKQISEIKAALESKYAQLQAALDKKKAEEEAQRQRYEEEQRKERMISWSISIIAALVFIYGIYRAVRQFIRWRKSKPRIKKPLRIWQKILSGWILWGVLVGVYAFFFEEGLSDGVVFYPPIAATIAFIWWRWIKGKSQATPPEGTP